MRHQLLFGVLPLVAGLLLVAGCEAASPAPPRSVPVVEVTGEPEFFCQLNFVDEYLYTLAIDHAAGNRRSADAWAMLDRVDPPPMPSDQHRQYKPYKPYKELMHCWRGALYYLGAVGARTELPRLIQMATHDPTLAAQSAGPEGNLPSSDLAMYRASADQQLYFALAAQVRRQLMFDGRLDVDGARALRLVEICASEVAYCMPATPMHRYGRDDLQRAAVRGLGISSAPSSEQVLEDIAATLPSRHFLLPYAYHAALDIKAGLDARQLWLLGQVPRP